MLTLVYVATWRKDMGKTLVSIYSDNGSLFVHPESVPESKVNCQQEHAK